MPTHNPLQELRKLGQSIWLDDIGRQMLADGSLARLIAEDGVAGVTSNPSILAHSITERSAVRTGHHRAAAEDPRKPGAVRGARDRGPARRRGSVQTSVRLAAGARWIREPRSLAASGVRHRRQRREARRLWGRLQRANAFIKIPGTLAGACGDPHPDRRRHQCERHAVVLARALSGCCQSLLRRSGGASRGGQAHRARRLGRELFPQPHRQQCRSEAGRAGARGQTAARALRGKAAIASAAQAYQIYEELIASPRWQSLASRGARTQRLLWASTSTKDPDLQPDQVCRGADRPRHGQHRAAGDDQRLPAAG